jgi:hypothetical protein
MIRHSMGLVLLANAAEEPEWAATPGVVEADAAAGMTGTPIKWLAAMAAAMQAHRHENPSDMIIIPIIGHTRCSNPDFKYRSGL